MRTEDVVEIHIEWMQREIERLADELWEESAKPEIDHEHIARLKAETEELRAMIERYRAFGLSEPAT